MKNIIKKYVNTKILLMDTVSSPLSDYYLLLDVKDEYFIIEYAGQKVIYPFTSIFSMWDDDKQLVIFLNSEIQEC